MRQKDLLGDKHRHQAYLPAARSAFGSPIASIGSSVVNIYKGCLQLQVGLHFMASQSGASPDIAALSSLRNFSNGLRSGLKSSCGGPCQIAERCFVGVD